MMELYEKTEKMHEKVHELPSSLFQRGGRYYGWKVKTELAYFERSFASYGH